MFVSQYKKKMVQVDKDILQLEVHTTPDSHFRYHLHLDLPRTLPKELEVGMDNLASPLH